MHLSRDTHNLLNESIRSLSLEEDYDILTEEQFNEAYEDYIDFLIENYTDEELENLTEEELINEFLSKIGHFAGGFINAAREKAGKAIKAVKDDYKGMKTGWERGLAGELDWLGRERYPSKEEPKKDESPTEKATRMKEGEKTPESPKKKTKLTPEQIEALKNSPEAAKKRKQRAASKGGDELASTTMKQRMASKGLTVNRPEALGGGTTLSPAGKAAASNVKDKSIKAAETVKNTMLNKKRGAVYSKCIEKGRDEKDCMRYASSIMASKEYYSDLRKRLIENYKK